MARYFFDLFDNTNVFDEIGLELTDLKAVRKHMLSLAIKLMMSDGRLKDKWQIEAVDETGKVVATMDFGITDEGRLT